LLVSWGRILVWPVFGTALSSGASANVLATAGFGRRIPLGRFLAATLSACLAGRRLFVLSFSAFSRTVGFPGWGIFSLTLRLFVACSGLTRFFGGF
jgi:hypothetical protein